MIFEKSGPVCGGFVLPCGSAEAFRGNTELSESGDGEGSLPSVRSTALAAGDSRDLCGFVPGIDVRYDARRVRFGCGNGGRGEDGGGGVADWLIAPSIPRALVGSAGAGEESRITQTTPLTIPGLCSRGKL